MVYKIAPAIALALALAACATPPPPPPALLAIDWREDCGGGVDLSSAIDLVPEKEKKRYTITQDIPGATGPCTTRDDGRKATYAVFRLPDFAPQSVMIAGSALEDARIFAPDVSLLDETGAVSRRFSREDFLFQGVVYGVQFKPRDTEKFLLIMAAPELVGDEYESVTLGIDSQMICGGYFCMNTYSGIDYETTRQFSYSGKVSVLVQDMRK